VRACLARIRSTSLRRAGSRSVERGQDVCNAATNVQSRGYTQRDYAAVSRVVKLQHGCRMAPWVGRAAIDRSERAGPAPCRDDVPGLLVWPAPIWTHSLTFGSRASLVDLVIRAGCEATQSRCHAGMLRKGTHRHCTFVVAENGLAIVLSGLIRTYAADRHHRNEGQSQPAR
jgi:hypothetical protein